MFLVWWLPKMADGKRKAKGIACGDTGLDGALL